MHKNLYKALTFLATPLLPVLLKLRVKKGKELAERYQEKLGVYDNLPADRSVIWLHCASVGETKLLAFVIEHLLKNKHQVLLTTVTKTSAQLAQSMFGKYNNFQHRFAVLDSKKYIAKFLSTWQVKFAIWAESEIWPNLLEQSAKKFDVILLNARLGDNSIKRWSKAKSFAKNLFSNFTKIYTQGQSQKEIFESFGLTNIEAIENVKYASVKTTKSVSKIDNLWVAVSTHEGEEDICIKTHNKLLEKQPDLVTVIIPRHPDRDFKKKYSEYKNIKFKSDISNIKPQNLKAGNIYFIDKIGEVETYLQVSIIVFVGGSLVKHGGHNPIEPASYNCTILFGEHMFNFKDIEQDFLQNKAAINVSDHDLVSKIEWLLEDKKAAQNFAANALELVKKKSKVKDKVIRIIDEKIKEAENASS